MIVKAIRKAYRMRMKYHEPFVVELEKKEYIKTKKEFRRINREIFGKLMGHAEN